MTDLIYGINPLTISRVKVQPFKRIGKHPLYYRLFKKKKPIRYWLGDYDGYYETACDLVFKPSVFIMGADNKALVEIACKSNDQAYLVKEQIEDMLIAFLRELKKQ